MKDSIKTESIEHSGHTITINWFYDQDCEAPWEHEDGHGPVSEWTNREKRPGERVLVQDRHSKRYYDFAEAIKIAKRDGWDAPPYKTGTRAQQAARAVERDFEYLKGWCNDEWHWAGYQIEIEGMAYEDSLWGIDSPSIDQFTTEALETAKAWLDKELAEAASCANRGIVTA